MDRLEQITKIVVASLATVLAVSFAWLGAPNGDREDNMRKLLLANVCLASLLVGGDALGQASNDLIVQLPTKLYLSDAGTPDPSAASSNVESLESLSGWEASVAATSTDLSAQANAFLSANADSLGLAGGAATVELVGQRNTMVGPYLEYRQTLNGIPILSSQVALSLTKEGELNAVTTSIVQIPENKIADIAKTAELSGEAALDIAWRDLAPSGDLLEPARTELAYVPEANALTLLYVVDVAVAEPFGYWRYEIDATTGRIIEKTKREVQEGKRLGDAVPQAVGAPALDYATALENLKARQGAALAAPAMGKVGRRRHWCSIPIRSPLSTTIPCWMIVTQRSLTPHTSQSRCRKSPRMAALFT